MTQNGEQGKAVILHSVQGVKEVLERGLATLEDALPEHVRPERFVKTIFTVVHQNPKLLGCTRSSFFLAVLHCAELGLEPHLSQAWILPYYNKGLKQTEANFQIGFRGYQVLALRSGRYHDLNARVVFEKDAFDFELGLNPRLAHRPHLEDDPGPMKWVYSIAWPQDREQRPSFEVMSRAQVEQSRKQSKAPDSPAWVGFYGEMCRKTVFARHAKWLDLSPEMQDALAQDNLTHGDLMTSAAAVLLRKAGTPTEVFAMAEEVAALPAVPTRTEEVGRKLEDLAEKQEQASQRAEEHGDELKLRLEKAEGLPYMIWAGDLPGVKNLAAILHEIHESGTVFYMWNGDKRSTAQDVYAERIISMGYPDPIGALERYAKSGDVPPQPTPVSDGQEEESKGAPEQPADVTSDPGASGVENQHDLEM